ncbi:hypothetical protein [Kamptonema formosum]|uniref:hypothetical protein n=1 Tax=Kamptonema formosum TaxID=331992 RepID=UPI00034D1175
MPRHRHSATAGSNWRRWLISLSRSGQEAARRAIFRQISFRFARLSHFLYFAGAPKEGAAIRQEAGRLELFADAPPPKSALWHAEMPARQEIAGLIGAGAAFPMAPRLKPVCSLRSKGLL